VPHLARGGLVRERVIGYKVSPAGGS